MHERSRRQFDIEIGRGLPFPGEQARGLVGGDDQAEAVLLDGRDEIKVRIAVQIGQDPAQVGIAGKILDQAEGPMGSMKQFGAQDRTEAERMGDLDKSNRSVQTVGVR